MASNGTKLSAEQLDEQFGLMLFRYLQRSSETAIVRSKEQQRKIEAAVDLDSREFVRKKPQCERKAV